MKRLLFNNTAPPEALYPAEGSRTMYDKNDSKPFEWKDLHGKTLEIHYSCHKGHYCLIGVDKETDIMYLLASGREE